MRSLNIHDLPDAFYIARAEVGCASKQKISHLLRQEGAFHLAQHDELRFLNIGMDDI
jgi:hypothetical protein